MVQSKKCTDSDELTYKKRDLLQMVFEDAAKWWSAALSINRVVGPFQFNTGRHFDLMSRRIYGESVKKSFCPVSDTLRSTIVPNTDIFIIITARPSNKRGFTARCAADQKYRPTIAHINIAPEFLEITPYKKLLNTAIHEIGHALGFSPFYYNYYLDAYGVPRGKSNVIRKFQERGHEVLKLITPSAVRAARRHFGSMLVNGLELEDSGGKGTAQAHVEKRIYGNEIMTGWPSSLLGVASDILLSVFEDMGWYRVSKNYAESLHHGNGEGLQFAERRCNKWPRTYFCSSMNAEIGCTADGRAKAFCQNFEFKSQLPSHYQYFSDWPRKGGYSELNDHCPIFNMQPLSCADASSKGSYRKIEVLGNHHAVLLVGTMHP